MVTGSGISKDIEVIKLSTINVELSVPLDLQLLPKDEFVKKTTHSIEQAFATSVKGHAIIGHPGAFDIAAELTQRIEQTGLEKSNIKDFKLTNLSYGFIDLTLETE